MNDDLTRHPPCESVPQDYLAEAQLVSREKFIERWSPAGNPGSNPADDPKVIENLAGFLWDIAHIKAGQCSKCGDTHLPGHDQHTHEFGTPSWLPCWCGASHDGSESFRFRIIRTSQTVSS